MSKEEHAGEGTAWCIVRPVSCLSNRTKNDFRIGRYADNSSVGSMFHECIFCIGLACFTSSQLDERHPNSKRQPMDNDLCHGHDKPYCCLLICA